MDLKQPETDKYVIGVILTGVTFCPKPWQNSATHSDSKSQQQLLRWQRNPEIIVWNCYNCVHCDFERKLLHSPRLHKLNKIHKVTKVME